LISVDSEDGLILILFWYGGICAGYDKRWCFIEHINIYGIVLHVMSAYGVLIRQLADDGEVLLPNQLVAVNLSCSPVRSFLRM
jgi:hypothetical protein